MGNIEIKTLKRYLDTPTEMSVKKADNTKYW